VVPDEHLEFLQEVWSRRPVFTYIFLGINILVFLLMTLAGGSMNEPTLLGFGAKQNSAIDNGQWWRFITPIFIHIGLIHLFFNSYALWIVGPQVEKLYGPARFVLLYVGTGVAGVAASYFYNPGVPSAGASGAIFGLFGVLLVFGLRYRNSIPPFFKRAVGTGVLPVIIINLIIGFTMSQFIDNSAHLGGLLAGAALAALIPYQQPGSETPGVFKTLQMVLLATIVVSFFEVARNYDGPNLSFRNLASLSQILTPGSTSNDFVVAVNGAQNAFQASVNDFDSNDPGRIAARKPQIAKAIDLLRGAPSLSPSGDKLTADFLRIMQSQYELIDEVERSKTVTILHSRLLRDNAEEYKRASDELENWVETEGKRHGIVSK
jgi:rhomboid protease GluP